MTQAQLIDTVKSCLGMIEQLENKPSAGARKLEEMWGVRKLFND